MNKEEAIKWLGLLRRTPIAWDDYSEETTNIRRTAEAKEKEAIDIAIEALKAQSEWIPCSERLPEVGTKCLLRYSNGKCSGGIYKGNRTWSVDYNDEDLSVTVSDWLQFKLESEGE